MSQLFGSLLLLEEKRFAAYFRPRAAIVWASENTASESPLSMFCPRGMWRCGMLSRQNGRIPPFVSGLDIKERAQKDLEAIKVKSCEIFFNILLRRLITKY